MEVVYIENQPQSTPERSIFLAGPTPHNLDSSLNWRRGALSILRGLEFDGTVFVPTPLTGRCTKDNLPQIKWVLNKMRDASRIAFWVPRHRVTMPAVTTGFELGRCLHLANITVGCPDNAQDMEYIRESAAQEGVAIHSHLRTVLEVTLHSFAIAS